MLFKNSSKTVNTAIYRHTPKYNLRITIMKKNKHNVPFHFLRLILKTIYQIVKPINTITNNIHTWNCQLFLF